MVCFGRILTKAQHLAQELFGRTDAPGRDVAAAYSQHEICVAWRLGERPFVGFERLGAPSRRLEQESPLEREAGMILVDGADLVENFRRLLVVLIAAQGDGEAEASREILLVELEGAAK